METQNGFLGPRLKRRQGVRAKRALSGMEGCLRARGMGGGREQGRERLSRNEKWYVEFSQLHRTPSCAWRIRDSKLWVR